MYFNIIVFIYYFTNKSKWTFKVYNEGVDKLDIAYLVTCTSDVKCRVYKVIYHAHVCLKYDLTVYIICMVWIVPLKQKKSNNNN